MLAYNKYKSHPKRDENYGRKAHRVMVEQILNRSLPKEVDIHHIDYDKSNNTHTNLVVCPNRSYHKMLHRRQEVLDAGYSTFTHHKCTDCLQFKTLLEFSKNKTRASGYNNLCKKCDNHRNKERYHRRKKCYV